ncbi:MAG: TAXI family TRAP transporter solute-binding subunit [Deltaproteobacteria bacterium]|nr:TAXI family TRAP transporter solute-binding subunit [Deltaproteobacteria bacterium]
MSKSGTFKVIFFSVIVLVFTFTLQGAVFKGGMAHGAVKQLSMGTASVGGLFYNIGNPVAQCINRALPEVNVTAEFTEGSTENLRLIDQKKIDLAVISPMIGYFARNKMKMFSKKAIDFRVVVRLLPNGNVWTVLKKSKIYKIRDLKGKKVGVGTGGIGVISRLQLAAHGINYKKDIKPYFLPTGALADALKDGTVDGSFLTAELAKMVTATHEIRILPWEEKDIVPYIKKNPYFGRYIYPANYFKGVDYPVLTVDNGIQLICRKDLSDELVYKLTKAILENLDCIASIYAPAKAMSREFSATELGNPYHPGAIRYFKEQGLWK